MKKLMIPLNNYVINRLISPVLTNRSGRGIEWLGTALNVRERYLESLHTISFMVLVQILKKYENAGD
jgi:hypothetical protein